MKASYKNDPETGGTFNLEFDNGITANFNAKPESGPEGLHHIKMSAYFTAAQVVGQENAEQAFMEMDNEIAAQGGLL